MAWFCWTRRRAGVWPGVHLTVYHDSNARMLSLWLQFIHRCWVAYGATSKSVRGHIIGYMYVVETTEEGRVPTGPLVVMDHTICESDSGLGVI